MMRLEREAKDIADRLLTAGPMQRRNATLAACELALKLASVTNSVVLSALDQYKTNGAIAKQSIAEVKEVAEHLDEGYFAATEATDTNGTLGEEALRLFGQARAVSAVLACGGQDSLESAMDAIYEALAATDQREAIRHTVLVALTFDSN
jgi:uncharacterized protein YciI